MLQDVERFFIVGITVAVVGTEPVAGKVSLGGFVQTGGQLVGLCVSWKGVGAPASGTVPHSAATGRIDVDADDEGVVRFVSVADGHTVDAPAAFLQGDVLLFGHDERSSILGHIVHFSTNGIFQYCFNKVFSSKINDNFLNLVLLLKLDFLNSY